MGNARRVKEVLGCGVVALLLWGMPAAASAATVTIRGYVRDAATKAGIRDALVTAELVGAPTYIYPAGFIPHDTVFARTTVAGYYKLDVRIPVPPGFEIRLRAATTKVPFYTPTEVRYSTIFNSSQLQDGSTISQDLALAALTNGVVVEGYLTDHDYGNPIPGATVSANYQVGSAMTYSNGYYLLALKLPSTGVGWAVTLKTTGGLNLRYPGQSKSIAALAGRNQRVDFSISQDVASAAYVFGRIVNRTTGQPIPYANVVLNPECIGRCPAPVGQEAATTDQFGHFVQDVRYLKDVIASGLQQPTTGVTGRIRVAVYGRGVPGSFQDQEIIIDAPALGSSQEANLDLTPN